MADIRIHHYSVDQSHTDEWLSRRTAVINAIRADHPGLVETRLIRLEDGTYLDAWRWASAAQMQAANAAAATIPEVAAAMALTRHRTAEDGQVIDER